LPNSLLQYLAEAYTVYIVQSVFCANAAPCFDILLKLNNPILLQCSQLVIIVLWLQRVVLVVVLFVLQVNRSPSFATDEQLDYDIKSAVIEDAVRMLNIKYSSSCFLCSSQPSW